MKRIAFIFPGQGAQFVGMGKCFSENFPHVRDIFREASEILKYDLFDLCVNGPYKELLKTEKAQPAILTTSISILRALESEGLSCDITAGLSLGEFSALVNAKSLDFKDAVALTEKRGFYMEDAVPYGVGGMAAIIGLDSGQIQECVNSARGVGVINIANHNTHHQILISGEIDAVKYAMKKAKERGAKKSVLLPVKHPFHTILMSSAGERLKADLDKLNIKNLSIPVVINYEAKAISKAGEVVHALVKQISNPVLWLDSVKLMLKEGVNIFIELGPGSTLTTFVKGIAENEGKKIIAMNIEDINEFKIVIKELNNVLL